MPCSHIEPAKGHQREKKCSKPEYKDGLCIAHQPKPVIVAPTAVVLTWQPQAQTDNTVNATFQDLCDDMADRIEAVTQNGIHPGGESFTGNKGAQQLLHDTQPHINNVFFYRWVGNVLVVYGVGNHTGKDNKHYSLTWYDGSSAAVDLNKKKIT